MREKGLGMTDVIGKYEQYLRACGWAERTVELRLSVARKLTREYGAALTADNLSSWLGRPGMSSWTRHTYYSCAKDFCDFLTAAGVLMENPVTAMRRPRAAKSLPRALSDEEVKRIREAATGDLVDYVALALYAGFRAHEIAKVRGEDVTAESVFVRGKGGVEAFLPTHSEVWAVAERHAGERSYWFPGREDGHVAARTVTTKMSVFFKGLGIEGATHRLRHTFATNLLRQGVNLKLVQDLMRHSSLGTTEIYLKVMHDERADAIRKLAS